MRISEKILIPNLVSLSVVAAALLFLVYQLHQDGARVESGTERVKTFSYVSMQLDQIEHDILIELLSYRYDRDDVHIETIRKKEMEHRRNAEILAQNIDTPPGTQLLREYLQSRRATVNIQAQLTAAVARGDEGEMSRIYRRWLLKNEQSQAQLKDLITYKLTHMQILLDDIEARRVRTSITVLLIALFTCGSIIVSSLYYGQAIARPLVTLTDVSDRIARGEVNTRIETESRLDEVGRLARSFNHMADRLVNANEELERKVERRTAELAETNEALKSSLAEVKRMQESLLQSERLAAIGQMVTGLSHESRNALQRSLACLELLGKRLKDNVDALRLLGEARKAQTDLQQVYEGVREYAGPLNLERTETCMREVWRSAWDKTALLREGRKVELMEDTNGSDLRCTVDPFRFEQVFRNLIENSLAACADPVQLRIRCADDMLRGRPVVRIVVADNGPGLTKHEQEHIFEPFFTTKTKGTGLGMSIVKRIVEAHGGQVSASPMEQRGVAITLMVPREKTA